MSLFGAAACVCVFVCQARKRREKLSIENNSNWPTDNNKDNHKQPQTLYNLVYLFKPSSSPSSFPVGWVFSDHGKTLMMTFQWCFSREKEREKEKKGKALKAIHFGCPLLEEWIGVNFSHVPYMNSWLIDLLFFVVVGDCPTHHATLTLFGWSAQELPTDGKRLPVLTLPAHFWRWVASRLTFQNGRLLCNNLRN